ncbi:TIGR02391 family protein [Ralstonia sp. CHL-2022]|uniref:TIGR02391 family protein n=1 Tax=Ralstonia mojiangensis TaxID=2953895 RepID=A0ABT2LBZ0_9RALS|nr:TIGR02391 family protein [Ralstonia mojiangensis]MCT7312407.1 TIGR02391 family protein [Ralstonia mojiangensis]
METAFDLFESIVRRTIAPSLDADEPAEQGGVPVHPFELHNIHPGFPRKVRSLFDDGYGAEATFHAFKFIEKIVQRHSNSTEIGRKLMMAVFNKNNPKIRLNRLSNASEEDEQEGYSFIFSGAVMAIRNPGGHEIELSDDPDVCLEHLAFGTFLLRRLERSGFKTN